MNTQFREQSRGLTGPILMILAGSIFLVGQFVPDLDFGKLWPLLLIGAGVAALFSRR